MADITYCTYSGCPLKKCERHPSKISKAAMSGKGYVSVADFSGTCREYLSWLLDEVEKEKRK